MPPPREWRRHSGTRGRPSRNSPPTPLHRSHVLPKPPRCTVSPDAASPTRTASASSASTPATASMQPTSQPGRRWPALWHQATAVLERIPHRLDQPDNQASQAHIAAFGEALDALPILTPQDIRPQLRDAATVFERATRSRFQAEHRHALALRGAVRAMLREPAPTDGAVLAMFLDAAILVVIAAARWHELRHHDQQVAAAHQTLLHLRAAYDQAAAAPLAALAQRRPPQQTVNRHVRHLRHAVPDHAEQIIDDPAFDALTTTLAQGEAAGRDPVWLLQQVADQRALDDADSAARVLTWRLQRLSARLDPSAGARAAQDRSAAAQRIDAQVHKGAAVTAPQPPQVRQR